MAHILQSCSWELFHGMNVTHAHHAFSQRLLRRLGLEKRYRLALTVQFSFQFKLVVFFPTFSID